MRAKSSVMKLLNQYRSDPIFLHATYTLIFSNAAIRRAKKVRLKDVPTFRDVVDLRRDVMLLRLFQVRPYVELIKRRRRNAFSKLLRNEASHLFRSVADAQEEGSLERLTYRQLAGFVESEVDDFLKVCDETDRDRYLVELSAIAEGIIDNYFSRYSNLEG